MSKKLCSAVTVGHGCKECATEGDCCYYHAKVAEKLITPGLTTNFTNGHPSVKGDGYNPFQPGQSQSVRVRTSSGAYFGSN